MNYLNIISQIIFDKKGFNILALDVKGLSAITDFIIIAEGNIERHVIAIAKAVIEGMKELGQLPLHVEGLTEGDWVVLDYASIMIHLFMPGMREKYQLEKLFEQAKVVDLTIDTSKPILKK